MGAGSLKLSRSETSKDLGKEVAHSQHGCGDGVGFEGEDLTRARRPRWADLADSEDDGGAGVTRGDSLALVGGHL